MDNSELLEKLKKNEESRENEKNAQAAYRKYVVFFLGSNSYALPASDVKEISFDNSIYYIPFVPPYVRGYANRHGQPFTVIDLSLLFHNEKLESSTLMVLDIPGDQACLLITDVDEIVKVPLDDIHDITSDDDTSRYFLETINIRGKEIFVLRAQMILERLEKDIER